MVGCFDENEDFKDIFQFSSFFLRTVAQHAYQTHIISIANNIKNI